MMRLLLALWLLPLTSGPSSLAVHTIHDLRADQHGAPRSGQENRLAMAAERYAPAIKGEVAGFRLAGIEPDGDPLDQVALRTRLSPSGSAPAVNLVVESYLENFQPDTTPILPDLLHANRTATNLGGFLQGKALLTDDAGNVLYLGTFLAEAFLDNSNHAVMRLVGSGAAFGGSVSLHGIFHLRKSGSLAGSLTGQIALPAAARRQLLANRGKKMKPLKQILDVVTVRPAPMMGKATKGNPNAALRTGYSQHPASTTASRKISPWTIAAAIGAAVSFLMAGALFWAQRRRERTVA